MNASVVDWDELCNLAGLPPGETAAGAILPDGAGLLLRRLRLRPGRLQLQPFRVKS